MNKNVSCRKLILCLFSMALCQMLMCGCGSKAGDNTLAAVGQIEELDYETALQTLDAATAAGENPAHIARAKGIALYGLTRYDEAITAYTEALSYSDNYVDDFDFDVNYYMADAYEAMGDFSQAADIYSAIIGLRGKDVLSYYRRGVNYLRTGQHDDALSDFNRALELRKDDYDLRIEIAGRLSDYGYEEEGVQFLSSFLSDNEKKLSAFDKGRIYFYMKDYDNAKLCLEEARDDDNQNTILFLGKTYEMLGDYNYATSTYQNYLSKHPEAAVIYNQLGLSRLQSGDYAGALDAFSTAKNIGNTGIEQTLAYNEIVANEYTGNFKQASVDMETYLKKYPDDEAAQREYVFLSSR